MENYLIAWISVGGVIGWIAGRLIRGSRLSLLLDMVAGTFGGLLGGWMASIIYLDIVGSFIPTLIAASIGAVMVLFLLRPLKPE